MHDRPLVSRLSAAAAVLWAVGLLRLTLHGVSSGDGAASWVLVGSEAALADVAANVIAFVPLGALLFAAGAPMRRAMLLTITLSAVIELGQGLGVPGRYAALSDVIANSAGGALGAWLTAHSGKILRPSRDSARRCVGAWAVLIMLVLGGTRWLQAPGMPSTSYEGQHADAWNAERDHAHAVQVARFNGQPYAWGPLPNAAVVSLALAEGRLRLDVRVDPGTASPGVHRLAAVIAANPSHASLARLETAGHDLRFSSRVRATAFGLHEPFVRLADALPDPATVARAPLELGGAREANRMSVWVHAANGPASQAELLLTPLDGWMFIAPPVLASRVPVVVARGLVLLLLFGPLCWWAFSSLPVHAPR